MLIRLAGPMFALSAIVLAIASALFPARAGAAIAVTVDTAANVHAFSPLIFGVAFGDQARNAQVGYTVQRWGGNSVTRYNWQVDVHNSASDYYFENIPGASDRSHVPPLGNAADAFVGAARSAGSDVLLTIPTIGWAPRSDSPLQHPYFAGFSVMRYGAQQSTDSYDPDAGNGVRTNDTPITGNDPADTSTPADPAFQKAWVAHLASTFGSASGNGVKYYALDNEIMLWNSTHRDVHPSPTTYDEAWSTAIGYATAIKQQDPAANVTGPVTWGYCDLFGSAADNCLTGSDRNAHGGLPFVAWYAKQVCSQPLAGGARAIDYMDLHYYPQGNGIFSDDDSPDTAARRLASLKELYDPAWNSDSWISDLGDTDANHYSKPNLIPRVMGWIHDQCGTAGIKLAITEYNWGGDNTTSGAVAQAELFGIFAREGVDMATRWVAPAADSKVEHAFSLFLDYDGIGSRVQGSSVSATSANVDQLGAYAFTATSRTFVLLTNKTSSTQTATVEFAASPGSTWTVYGFDATHAVHAISTGAVTGTTISVAGLPAMSGNLLVVSGNDVIFLNGFE